MEKTKKKEVSDEAMERLATAVAEVAGDTMEERQMAFLLLLDSACVLFLRSSSNADHDPVGARELIMRTMGKAFDRALKIKEAREGAAAS